NRGFSSTQTVKDFSVLRRPDEADEPAALFYEVRFVGAEVLVLLRRPNLHDQVRGRPEFTRVIDNSGSGLSILTVCGIFSVSGTGLDRHVKSEFLEFQDRLRSSRDALFSRM